ncbi:MAG: tRNA lysidine(34) synthetase TilS [Gammaproteobacteria bacterium]
MPLHPDQLIDHLLELAPAASGYWVAFSGGLDSQVLLHALAARRARLPGLLGALHVNHNLQDPASAWAAHCRKVCADLAVPYRVLEVDAQPAPGESPEAAARAARYRALAGAVPPDGVLLTAHHRDDQAETLLLQLLRGAGPKGLAAMPASIDVAWVERQRNPGFAPLNPGYPVRLVRPLLECARDDLHAYAQGHDLAWIEDPSNACTDYDRNFLRHEILPRLRARWPALGATLARSAGHQAEATGLLDELAALDLAPGPAHTLSVSALLRLSAPRRANLLRHWLARQRLPLPSRAVLAEIDRALLHAAADAQPVVCWGGVCLRRYRDALMIDAPATAGAAAEAVDSGRCIDWAVQQPLSLPAGILSAEPVRGGGVACRHLEGGRCQVRFRRGGERLQPAGRRQHHSLKHLFQEAGVPPWERARVPLIYRGDTLIAVAGHWVCEGFQAAENQAGLHFLWRRAIVPAGSFW